MRAKGAAAEATAKRTQMELDRAQVSWKQKTLSQGELDAAQTASFKGRQIGSPPRKMDSG